MTEYIAIHWTTGSLDEARRVSRFLVQERHVACAQIVPWIESIYMWDNEMQTTQESKVVMKTRKEMFNAVKEIILENASYEVPEITCFDIVDGNSEFLQWVAESTPALVKE